MTHLSATFPGALIKDPVLEPVDKLIGLVIRLARETDGHSTFPGYEAIGRMANVGSRSTIARAMAILRATRWLSRCMPTHEKKGSSDSSDYVLHDQPLPLADALRQDPDYLDFLTHACAHGHARVRAVAQGVLDAIKEGPPVTSPLAVQPRVLPIHRLVSHLRVGFCFSRRTHRRLRHDLIPHQSGHNHRVRNSNSAGQGVRISNSGCSSSCININTTTTTTGSASSNSGLAGEGDPPLVYPARLCARQRAQADRCLSALAPADRQAVLDELEGRFQAEKQGMPPVFDEIRFLTALCQRVKAGTFQPNLGIKVQKGRRRRSAPDPNRPPPSIEPRVRTQDTPWQTRKTRAKARIAEMRARLGQRLTTNIQAVTCGT